MPTLDIVPDIHGRADKLEDALARLGWRRGAAGWRGPAPGARLLFLGDFIDRGPENRAVLARVRDLVGGGHARAVMGNHELNALLYHGRHPDDGRPLRPNDAKNARQHASFLAEFPPGAPQTRDALDWMRGLPLTAEVDGLRAVHACWDAEAARVLAAETGDGTLDDAALLRAAGRDPDDPLFLAVETLAKGPEVPLPPGHAFGDKDGTRRDHVRLRWWNPHARRWRDAAISVPDPAELPDAPLPDTVRARTYPPEAPPVVFGHYWLTGAPRLQAANALCLDYSAGRDGPLVTYRHEAGRPLDLDAVTVHPTG